MDSGRGGMNIDGGDRVIRSTILCVDFLLVSSPGFAFST